MVTMTGAAVNDASAVKAADIGTARGMPLAAEVTSDIGGEIQQYEMPENLAIGQDQGIAREWAV